MQNFTISNSVLVNLDFTIWTGKAKLDATDIPEAAAAMPPKDLCTAGNIKIFDTDYLKPFRNLKNRADLCAASIGCRLMSGWLVDDANIGQLENGLADIHLEWARTLADFAANYQQRAKEWALLNGTWDQLIRRKQPADHEIKSRFHFGWQTFRLTPETAGASVGNETDNLVQAIPDQALQSIIDSLRDLYNDSFNKTNDPSSKAYGALRKIAQRAQALGFANPNAARLAPVLMDLVNRKNHMLSRLVLSRMDKPRDVEDILQVNAGQGIDSLLAPVEETQLEPTALEQAKQPVMQPSFEEARASVRTDSLLERAKQILVDQPVPVSVDADGNIVMPLPEGDNAILTTAGELQGIVDSQSRDLAAEARDRYDKGIITSAECNERLCKLLDTGRISQEQFDANCIRPWTRALGKLKEQFVANQIDVKAFNAQLDEWRANGAIPPSVYEQNRITEPQPQPQPQPLNSMDVLDSLGLF